MNNTKQAEHNIEFVKETTQKVLDKEASNKLIKEGFNKCRKNIVDHLDELAHDLNLTQEQRNLAWALHEKYKKLHYKSF